MSHEQSPITSICADCGRPVAVPTHLATELPKQPRHLGIPGEPVACPK